MNLFQAIESREGSQGHTNGLKLVVAQQVNDGLLSALVGIYGDPVGP